MKILSVCLSLALVALPWPAGSQVVHPAQTQELVWPQRFDVQGLQARSLGFAVTAPGLLVVSVQPQGTPVSVAIVGPLPNSLPQPVPQSGPGGLQFVYNLTPQDIQRGIFWQVTVRLASAAAVQPGARATGTITLQRPPVNQGVVQQGVQALMAQHHARTAQELDQSAVQTKAQLNAAFGARKAQFAQHLALRQAAVMAQLQPTLEAMRREKAMQLPDAMQAPADAAVGGSGQIRSRGLDPQLQIRKIAQPLPFPAITTMAIANNQDTIPLPPGSYGQPGDLVTLTGTNFGSADGELHFVIGPLPSQDMIVPPNNMVWLNTRIMAPVPLVTGVRPYSGIIYVKRHSDGAKSAAAVFKFQPNVEQREIRFLNDLILDQTGCSAFMLQGRENLGGITVLNGNIISGYDVYRDDSFSYFQGCTAVDHFFINTRLQNGWKVIQQPFTYTPQGGGVGGSAIVLPTPIGTDVLSTYTVVSVNPAVSFNATLDYGIVIPIQGPSGIVDGLVCKAPPAAGNACPETD